MITKTGVTLQIRKWASKVEDLKNGIKVQAQDNEDFLFFDAIALHADVPNGNWDLFGKLDVSKSYTTFPGTPVNLNHDKVRVVGKIVEAFLVENGEDCFVEVIGKISKKQFPDVCEKISKGEINSVSMEAIVEEAICSIASCKKVAHNIEEFCDHLKNLGRETDGQRHVSINSGITFKGLGLMDGILPADSEALINRSAAEIKKEEIKAEKGVTNKEKMEKEELIKQVEDAGSVDDILKQMNAYDYNRFVSWVDKSQKTKQPLINIAEATAEKDDKIKVFLKEKGINVDNIEQYIEAAAKYKDEILKEFGVKKEQPKLIEKKEAKEYREFNICYDNKAGKYYCSQKGNDEHLFAGVTETEVEDWCDEFINLHKDETLNKQSDGTTYPTEDEAKKAADELTKSKGKAHTYKKTDAGTFEVKETEANLSKKEDELERENKVQSFKDKIESLSITKLFKSAVEELAKQENLNINTEEVLKQTMEKSLEVVKKEDSKVEEKSSNLKAIFVKSKVDDRNRWMVIDKEAKRIIAKYYVKDLEKKDSKEQDILSLYASLNKQSKGFSYDVEKKALKIDWGNFILNDYSEGYFEGVKDKQSFIKEVKKYLKDDTKDKGFSFTEEDLKNIDFDKGWKWMENYLKEEEGIGSESSLNKQSSYDLRKEDEKGNYIESPDKVKVLNVYNFDPELDRRKIFSLLRQQGFNKEEMEDILAEVDKRFFPIFKALFPSKFKIERAYEEGFGTFLYEIKIPILYSNEIEAYENMIEDIDKDKERFRGQLDALIKEVADEKVKHVELRKQPILIEQNLTKHSTKIDKETLSKWISELVLNIKNQSNIDITKEQVEKAIIEALSKMKNELGAEVELADIQKDVDKAWKEVEKERKNIDKEKEKVEKIEETPKIEEPKPEDKKEDKKELDVEEARKEKKGISYDIEKKALKIDWKTLLLGGEGDIDIGSIKDKSSLAKKVLKVLNDRLNGESSYGVKFTEEDLETTGLEEGLKLVKETLKREKEEYEKDMAEEKAEEKAEEEAEKKKNKKKMTKEEAVQIFVISEEKEASEYTDFTKKFLKDNPGSNIGDAAKAWKEQKGKGESEPETVKDIKDKDVKDDKKEEKPKEKKILVKVDWKKLNDYIEEEPKTIEDYKKAIVDCLKEVKEMHGITIPIELLKIEDGWKLIEPKAEDKKEDKKEEKPVDEEMKDLVDKKRVKVEESLKDLSKEKLEKVKAQLSILSTKIQKQALITIDDVEELDIIKDLLEQNEGKKFTGAQFVDILNIIAKESPGIFDALKDLNDNILGALQDLGEAVYTFQQQKGKASEGLESEEKLKKESSLQIQALQDELKKKDEEIKLKQEMFLKMEQEKIVKENELKEKELIIKKSNEQLTQERVKRELIEKNIKCNEIVKLMGERNMIKINEELKSQALQKGENVFDIEKNLMTQATEEKLAELMTKDVKALDLMKQAIESLPKENKKASKMKILDIVPDDRPTASRNQLTWDYIKNKISTSRKFNK